MSNYDEGAAADKIAATTRRTAMPKPRKRPRMRRCHRRLTDGEMRLFRGWLVAICRSKKVVYADVARLFRCHESLCRADLQAFMLDRERNQAEADDDLQACGLAG